MFYFIYRGMRRREVNAKQQVTVLLLSQDAAYLIVYCTQAVWQG